ncbi:tetraspanin-4 isoform X1 [Synchiropus splendidus]|uniref:tetraspanin-4 isoform X1 n=1 Tax=Synchiropus splendidus TaxID=270530 RepID=UPI00237ED46E|nr:tetraspanin-4 isoform X1 [Synchiropus splendidus]
MSVSRRCLCCVKYLMFIFNLVFWLGGCGLFGVGVWLSFTQAEFSSLPLSFPSLSAANLLLVAGGITMVTGFLGCLGALKEQRCLLFMFFVILLLLVLTEVTLTLVLHIFRDQLDSKAQDELKEGMKVYPSEPGLKKSWDNVQKMIPPYRHLHGSGQMKEIKFKCCGVKNKTDWYDVLNGTLPSSCCSVGVDHCVEGWSEPCYDKARQWLLDNIPSVLVFGICIGVVQILALVFSMLMYCQITCAEKYVH